MTIINWNRFAKNMYQSIIIDIFNDCYSMKNDPNSNEQKGNK
jgi:hypothetical protein